MPRLEILLFAIVRDVAASDTIALEMELPTTAAHILTAIGVAYPAMGPWLGSCRLAVDQVYVGTDQVIEHAAEIALIPPVSGG